MAKEREKIGLSSSTAAQDAPI